MQIVNQVTLILERGRRRCLTCGSSLCRMQRGSCMLERGCRRWLICGSSLCRMQRGLYILERGCRRCLLCVSSLHKDAEGIIYPQNPWPVSEKFSTVCDCWTDPDSRVWLGSWHKTATAILSLHWFGRTLGFGMQPKTPRECETVSTG